MPLLLLPGGLPPVPPVSPGLDLAATLSDVLSALGVRDPPEWCSQAEIYQWWDEGQQRLARRAGIWVDFTAPANLVIGQSTYSVPANFLDLIRASVDNMKLRESSTADLEALDSSWRTTGGPVQRISMDANAPNLATLYPSPSQAGQLREIYHRTQPAITGSSQAVIPIPSPLRDYFTFSVIGEARRKESDNAMLDMADHFQQRCDLMERVCATYWGTPR